MTTLRHGALDENGFSLVELMIVLALIGLALIPLSEIQFGSRRAVVSSDRYADAVAMAQESLESMRASGFSNAGADTFVVDGFTIATGIMPYVDPATGAALTSLERLTVNVTWNDRGDSRTVNLNCLQAER